MMVVEKIFVILQLVFVDFFVDCYLVVSYVIEVYSFSVVILLCMLEVKIVQDVD